MMKSIIISRALSTDVKTLGSDATSIQLDTTPYRDQLY